MISDDREWTLHARCRDEDPEMFFPPRTMPTDRRKRIVRKALMVCAQCPVRPECRQAVLDQDEQFGIWAGYDLNSRGGKTRLRENVAPVFPIAKRNTVASRERSA